jgi:hypothetical protein
MTPFTPFGGGNTGMGGQQRIGGATGGGTFSSGTNTFGGGMQRTGGATGGGTFGSGR